MDRNGNGGILPQKTRAEMFEDEKRRIIDSCFNKREPDGSCASFPCRLGSPPPRFFGLLQRLLSVVSEIANIPSSL